MAAPSALLLQSLVLVGLIGCVGCSPSHGHHADESISRSSHMTHKYTKHQRTPHNKIKDSSAGNGAGGKNKRPVHAEKSKLPRLWPLPHNFSNGVVDGGSGNTSYLTLTLEQAHNFAFDLQWIGNVDVLGNSTGSIGGRSSMSASSLLMEAFDRYHSIIFVRPASGSGSAPAARTSISSLLVQVHSPLDTLRYGVDESYALEVPHPSDASQALLQANTVFGALRGLETFSQLCHFNFETRRVEIGYAPWSISDKPRFSYRGLLIDTARHYQPPRVIKQVIDAMSYAKLNVLHWHIVDTQSFPLEIPSYPKLWKGAYSPSERYTVQDAQDIVEYARKRGVNVMAELDVPGHAASWGIGYPQLWPSRDCPQPLDVSRNFTFALIDGIISDFAKVFPFDFVHMGGDEVNTSCWKQIPRIAKWLKRNNYTGFDAYKQFVLRGEAISQAHGYTPVNWEEPFDLFGAQLSKNAVIHNWLGTGVAPKIVKAGFRCIVSNQDAWYLDHLNQPWETFYNNEPWTNITQAEERALVLGGEVCVWGEVVDASDIQQTIWPRAAAAAERLWSSLERLTQEPESVLPRLRHFRCLLNERGVAAAPVTSALGRDPPMGPGSCFSQ